MIKPARSARFASTSTVKISPTFSECSMRPRCGSKPTPCPNPSVSAAKGTGRKMETKSEETQMETDEHGLNKITETIIGCAYDVANGLGNGFLEKPYENALRMDLLRAGLTVLQQHPIPVLYRGETVGDYVADLIVEGAVLIELKAVRALDDIHTAQCLNYLKATGLKV